MNTITIPEERDRAAARLDRLMNLSLHAEAVIDAANHPGGDPLLSDAGRYVAAVLDIFVGDLLAEQETLSQAIKAWDASWGNNE